MSFPLDLGMVPRTLAKDGDPLDVLVIGDELAAAGCVITVRLLGIIKAEQTEKGHTYRNDRLLARKALSISCAHANHIDDLGPAVVDHLGRWFEQFSALKARASG
jgi:inorganic pyrophosphatase